jgi:hypothetical protein
MLVYIILGLLVVLAALVLASVLTNPFSRRSIIRKPYIAKSKGQLISATDNLDKITVHSKPWWTWFARLKMAIHILETRYVSSPRSNSSDTAGIIQDIHELRYNPEKLLLISGDHFSGLFVRNLGVFYYPTLDASIPSSAGDWLNRQLIYLDTVAYAIGVFHKYRTLTTTIVPTGPYGATCVNFYAYPSDTLYGIFYGIAIMSGIESGQPYSYKNPAHNLGTKVAASDLLSEYGETLSELYYQYRKTVYE